MSETCHAPRSAFIYDSHPPQLLVLFLHAAAVGGFVAGDVVPLVLEGEVAPFAAVGVLDGDVGGQGDDGVPQGDSGARCGGRLLRMHQAKCSISSR
jgi:hypothetical protein